MMDTEQFVRERFKSLITSANEAGKIKDRMFVQLSLLPLETLDDMEQANNEFIHFMTNYDYYDTLERIEKGERLLEIEPDALKQRKYQARLNQLYQVLEQLQSGGGEDDQRRENANHQQEARSGQEQRAETPHAKGAA